MMSSSSASARSSESRRSLMTGPGSFDHEAARAHLFAYPFQLRPDADISILPPVAAVRDAAHRLGMLDRMQISATNDPALRTFAVTEMRFAREDQCHLEIGGFDRARQNEGIIVRPALEYLEDIHRLRAVR